MPKATTLNLFDYVERLPSPYCIDDYFVTTGDAIVKLDYFTKQLPPEHIVRLTAGVSKLMDEFVKIRGASIHLECIHIGSRGSGKIEVTPKNPIELTRQLKAARISARKNTTTQI